jgi:hypothetical protein
MHGANRLLALLASVSRKKAFSDCRSCCCEIYACHSHFLILPPSTRVVTGFIPSSEYSPLAKESVHASVKGGMKYNTGRLLMVLQKPLIPQRGDEYDNGPRYGEEPDMGEAMLPMP